MKRTNVAIEEACDQILHVLHAGTGGIVDKINWRDINWTPIDALTGGTEKFKTGLGLKPWYVKGHEDPPTPGESPHVAPVRLLYAALSCWWSQETCCTGSEEGWRDLLTLIPDACPAGMTG